MLTKPVVEPLAALSSRWSPDEVAPFLAQSIACQGVRIVATWLPDVHSVASAGSRPGGSVCYVLDSALSTTLPVAPFWLSSPAFFSTFATEAVSVCGRLNVSL